MADGSAYREAPTAVPHAVIWRSGPRPVDGERLILPDGCLDLIWDGDRLFVAGPDSVARPHRTPAGTGYVGLRFHAGVGPALLGVAADEVLDTEPDLADVWGAGPARRLAEQVAADPVAVLRRWPAARAAETPPDPLGARLLALASEGLPVAAMADRLGLGARQLHRRALPLFGYAPTVLSRILRLNRALDEARRGRPLAEVAAEAGYTDQPHLTREVRALTGTTPRRLLTPDLSMITDV